MLEGLYNPNSPVQFDCVSTNCTWPEFTTLGICATCEDISSQIERNCFKPNTSAGIMQCNYRTPRGLQLQSSCQAYAGGLEATLWNSTTDYALLPSIAKIASIAFSANNIDQDCLNAVKQPMASDCKLSWCEKTFSSEVVNGTLKEIVVSTQDLIFPEDTCNREYAPGSGGGFFNWAKSTGTSLANGLGQSKAVYAAFTPDKAPSDICSDWQSQNHSPFWINVGDSDNIHELLSTLFLADSTSQAGTAFGELLYSVNDGNLSKDLMDIASSMTSLIRQGPDTTRLTGTVLTSETYIKLHWQWLIFPAAMVLLAILFFLAVVLFSAANHRVVWKSSTLALLYHGLSGIIDSPSTSKTSDLKDAARSVQVLLEEDENGELKLIRQ